jgi:hypothetical protein
LWNLDGDVRIRKLLLCDDGVVIMLLDTTIPLSPIDSTAGSDQDLLGLGYASLTPSPPRQYLACYSLYGVRLAIVESSVSISYLACPSRGSLVVCGLRDGTAVFRSSYTLEIIYSFRPHDRCLTSVIASGGRCLIPEPESAAILCIKFGPNPTRPSLMCVSTSSGALYVKALPDFIKWERGCYQSALSHIVNVPYQAVKGTLQQAHLAATDAAGTLASNAKSFADEALAKVRSIPPLPPPLC